ncbi:MAG: inositol monophosphatase [Arachnia sp.]
MDTEGILGLMQETAEAVITPRFRQLTGSDIDEKTPGDFVTIADREAEQYLGRLLTAAFPGALIVGEEAAFADRSVLRQLPNADHAFVIDPIDGTGNFVRGNPEHGVILAEVRGGVTTRGWIWQPQTGRGYAVERGAGVRVNGEPLTRKALDRPPLGGTSKTRLIGFDADGHLSPAVRSHFACAFDYPAVLHGEIDFTTYTNTHPWDHLAGSLMLTEVGGVSRTLDGMAYSCLTRTKGLLIAGDTISWLAAQQYWPVD